MLLFISFHYKQGKAERRGDGTGTDLQLGICGMRGRHWIIGHGITPMSLTNRASRGQHSGSSQCLTTITITITINT